MLSDVTYDELLDAVERLPIEKQEDLLTTVRERLAARRRDRLLADVQEAREYHAQGKTRPATVDEIMREIGL